LATHCNKAWAKQGDQHWSPLLSDCNVTNLSDSRTNGMDKGNRRSTKRGSSVLDFRRAVPCAAMALVRAQANSSKG
jgi:hypothetical protein